MMIPLLHNPRNTLPPPTWAAFLLALLAALAWPAQAWAETTPPTLLDFNFSPLVVDPQLHDAHVDVQVMAVDPPTDGPASGLSYVHVAFNSPSLGIVHAGAVVPPGSPLVHLNLTVPAGTPAEVWTFSELDLQDADGNVTWVDLFNFPTLTDLLPWAPTELTISPGSGVGGGDTTPPTLTAFNFMPKTVNVGAHDASVLVSLGFTDDSSGFSSADIAFTSPSGGQTRSATAQLSSGTNLSGSAQATLILPQGSETGTWTVSSVQLLDAAGNATTLDKTTLAGRGFPTDLNVSNLLTDTLPPVLTSLNINPASVDVSSNPANVTFSLHVMEDLSGFGWFSMWLNSPSYGQSLYVGSYTYTGDPYSGDIQADFTMPLYSEAGDWTINSLSLSDRAGNYQYLDSQTLQDLGFNNKFTVVDQNQDTTPPSLDGLSLSPGTVNVSSGPQAVTFTVNISDAPAGVNFCHGDNICWWMLNVQSPSGKQTQGEIEWNGNLTSGTQQNGVWQLPLTLPQYAEAGTWKINYLYLHDIAHNGVSFDASTLQARGFPSSFSVVSNPSDTQPPQLKSLSFTPSFADTTTGTQTITLTAGLTDNLAGLLSYNFSGKSPNLYNGTRFSFTSPSGSQGIGLAYPTLLGGTAKNGTWKATATLPQFSEAGTWTLTQAYLIDNAGNNVTYNATQLAAMGFPTSLQVILPSMVADGAVDPGTGGTVRDQVFGDRAEVSVPPGLLSQQAQVNIDVLSSDLHLPTPAGFTTNGSNFVNIKLTPEPTPPFPAPGLTITLPLINQMAPGTSLVLYRVMPNGTLSPEPGIGGGNVTGTVNADGVSATFSGVASLSTVAGLIPSGSVLGDVNGDDVDNCADMSIVKAAFGKRLGQAGFDGRADINHDNLVDVRDLAFVSRNLQAGVVCHIPANGVLLKVNNTRKN